MSSPDLWDETCEVLKHHYLAGHSCIDTINRLLRKNPHVQNPRSPPQVKREKLTVSAENRSLSQLWTLIHATQVTQTPPGQVGRAIVVLRLHDGSEYLMDGRRRINLWKRQGTDGPHRVLVVEESR